MKLDGKDLVKFEEPGFYSIVGNKDLNQIYMKIQGFWQEPGDVPNYNEDMEKCVGTMKQGFTILTEVDEDKSPKFAITKLHKKNQEILRNGGVGKAAVYFPKGRLLQTMTLNVVGKLSGMDVKIFNDENAAISWLNQS
jgi:hypothetical protein